MKTTWYEVEVLNNKKGSLSWDYHSTHSMLSAAKTEAKTKSKSTGKRHKVNKIVVMEIYNQGALAMKTNL